VGYDEGGQLTEAVRRKPYSVVLLDEIEKAHPDVFNILLQVLDDGRLTDNKGRVVDFKNTIIIMTSNIGSHLIQENFEKAGNKVSPELIEKSEREVFGLLRQTIRPEFLNRVDEVVMFTPLTDTELTDIVRMNISSVIKQLENNSVKLDVSDDAIHWLAKVGYDPLFGARPIKRAIQRHLLNELSKRILADSLNRDQEINITVENDELVFKN
jgi:ATP-dependent Clp protease ATP-binding subunit ClpB